MKFKCLMLKLFLLGGVLFASEPVIDETECVVFVCNKRYFGKFTETLEQLTTKGNYHGNICLIIGDDLVGSPLLKIKKLTDHNVIVKHFPDLQFTPEFLASASRLPNYDKLFQFHKLYLFDTYFKQWQTIFYMDCGMEIYSDIHPILATKKPGTLVAHSDAYPSFNWKLRDQFTKGIGDYYDQLAARFNLDLDYFQTTIMIFDTSLIETNTFDNLYNLTLQYPISHNNDQGIIALYFTTIVPAWQQIPLKNGETYLYDFMKRGRPGPFIMIKYPLIWW
jgi:hypothetical protein